MAPRSLVPVYDDRKVGEEGWAGGGRVLLMAGRSGRSYYHRHYPRSVVLAVWGGLITGTAVLHKSGWMK